MKQARTLNDKQLKQVFAHCATRRHAVRDRAILAVSFMSGLRAKEIAALTINNICDENKNIKDEFILGKDQTKGGKARRVFISLKLKKELAAYIANIKLRNGCAALFQSQKGAGFTANTMCQLFLNIYKDAGIDGASSHSGRRSLLTNLAGKGIGVRVLAEIAGHRGLATVQKYIDASDDQIRKAIDIS